MVGWFQTVNEPQIVMVLEQVNNIIKSIFWMQIDQVEILDALLSKTIMS